jgi:hypothetical protein
VDSQDLTGFKNLSGLTANKIVFRIRSHLASEYIDKPPADFVIVNLKMAGRQLNPHSQDASECCERVLALAVKLFVK